MMTTTETISRNTVEFVRLGFHDTSLHFRVGVRNWATFAACMQAIGDCNRFDGAEVTATFGDLFGDVMSVEVGRESSTVMYVTLPFWEHQRLGSTVANQTIRISDAERIALAACVIRWARERGADEVSVSQFPGEADDVWFKPGEHPHRIRIWWD